LIAEGQQDKLSQLVVVKSGTAEYAKRPLALRLAATGLSCVIRQTVRELAREDAQDRRIADVPPKIGDAQRLAGSEAWSIRAVIAFNADR
jgi:hypothetical protein